MVTIASGVAGGFVAAVVMTAFMMALGDDSPPPPSLFWSQYVGDGPPEEYVLPGMVLHLAYGTAAGGVFAVVASTAGLVMGSISMAIVWGLVWSVVLFVGLAAFWMRLVLGVEPEMPRVGMFLFFHPVYGVVLGGAAVALPAIGG